jgi:hypothetical protein
MKALIEESDMMGRYVMKDKKEGKMKNKLVGKCVKAFLSASLCGLMFGLLPARASGTQKVLELSQFKSEYFNLCTPMKGLAKWTKAKRSSYCECMFSEYKKRNYTTVEDLKVIRKMYQNAEVHAPAAERSSSEEEMLMEESLANFEQEMAEKCLAKVSGSAAGKSKASN